VNDRTEVKATPVFLDHVDQLFAHIPDDVEVNVSDPNAPASLQHVELCKQRPITL